MVLGNSLTSTGLVTATQSQLLTYFTDQLQTIYGSTINLNSDTPDGQWVNILIQSVLDLQDLLLQIYNSFDPDQAIGTQLDQRVTINGITRQAGTYSATNITLILSQSVNLYGLDQSNNPVFTVADSAGNQWQLITTQLGVGPGTVVYSFQASTPGAVLTTPNTIVVPVTIVLGVTSVNNPSAQTNVGLNEETDAALRLRRQQSVSIVSQGYYAGLLAAIENIQGVSSAFIFENNTNGTNANGVPSHTIWVIVAGTPTSLLAPAYSATTTYTWGQIASSGGVNYISWSNTNLGNAVSNATFWGVYNPVAMAIYTKRNAGCGMYGSTSYNVTQIDGTTMTIQWDTVVQQNLFTAFTVTSINGTNPPNIAAILSGLPKSFVPGVDATVNINMLSTLVQAIDSNTLVTNAGFSTALTQVATLSGVAASGTFMFSYGGNNTTAINWNDSASTIQTKVRNVTGLSTAVVTGSIASQTLTISLGSSSALTLLTVVSNSLQTAGSAAITFAFNEGYANTLAPTSPKFQFAVASNQIIILPMIMSPASLIIAPSGSQTFTGLGGYGTLVYTLSQNQSSGSINASTGVYVAGSNGGTDIVVVTDAFGNTASASVTVT